MGKDPAIKANRKKAAEVRIADLKRKMKLKLFSQTDAAPTRTRTGFVHSELAAPFARLRVRFYFALILSLATDEGSPLGGSRANPPGRVPSEPKLEVPLHVRPFAGKNAVHVNVAGAPVPACHIVANHAVLFRAERFNRLL